MTCLKEAAPRNSEAGRKYRARLQVLRRIIGANIEAVRKGQDMEIKTLSAKTGIRIRKLKYWQAGRMEITLAGIIRISAALDVPVSRLLRTRDVAWAAPEEDIAPETLPEDADGKKNADTVETPEAPEMEEWPRDLEVEIYKAVKRREKNPEGMPDTKTLLAMEEPMLRVMRSSILFCDLAYSSMNDDPPNPSGLLFLATSMRREADRLYRLYYGQHPDILTGPAILSSRP